MKQEEETRKGRETPPFLKRYTPQLMLLPLRVDRQLWAAEFKVCSGSMGSLQSQSHSREVIRNFYIFIALLYIFE